MHRVSRVSLHTTDSPTLKAQLAPRAAAAERSRGVRGEPLQEPQVVFGEIILPRFHSGADSAGPVELASRCPVRSFVIDTSDVEGVCKPTDWRLHSIIAV